MMKCLFLQRTGFRGSVRGPVGFFGLAAVCVACAVSPARADNTSSASYEALIALHEYKTPPGPHDWMAQHRERPQSFADFVAADLPAPQTGQKLYVLPLGSFDPVRRKALEATVDFMAVYFQMPVVRMDPVMLDHVPDEAFRVHPQTGDEQYLTTYLIEEVIVPRKPDDAFAVIALTARDLWPGEGWNFVFGQASLPDRAGVWSMYRNGNPRDPDDLPLILSRTLKISTHEMAHMFGLHHCPYFECAVNGSNHRVESDRRPLWLCPVCLRKLQHSIGFDVAERYRALQQAAGDLGLEEAADFYGRSLDAWPDEKF